MPSTLDGDNPIGLDASPFSAVREDRSKVLEVIDFGPLTYGDVHPGVTADRNNNH